MAGKKKTEVETELDVETGSKLDGIDFKELMKAIQKANGENSIMRASDERVTNFHKLPTGIFQLDYALGGGFPVGKVALVFGEFSSLKTSLILKTIGHAQKRCSICWVNKDLHGTEGTNSCEKFNQVTTAFIDVEKTFDSRWAAKLGVDNAHVMVIKPAFAEQAIDTADQLLRSGKIDILVLDSLAALVPMKEIEKSAENQMMGAQAKLIGTFCRKTSSAITELEIETGRAPTVFWTNQLREKITMFGDPSTMPGGKAFPFFTTSMVKLQKKKPVFEKETEKEVAPLYIPIEFTVTKNKMGVPAMEGEFRLITTKTEEKNVGDIYDENKVAETALRLDLLHQKDGKMMWYFNDEAIGTAKSAFERRLLVDPAFNLQARDLIMKELIRRL